MSGIQTILSQIWNKAFSLVFISDHILGEPTKSLGSGWLVVFQRVKWKFVISSKHVSERGIGTIYRSMDELVSRTKQMYVNRFDLFHKLDSQ